MAVPVVRIPSDTNSPAFVLAVAQARAAALGHGICLLEHVTHNDGSYLLWSPDGGFEIRTATLFDPPAWTTKAMRIIRRHGERE